MKPRRLIAFIICLALFASAGIWLTTLKLTEATALGQGDSDDLQISELEKTNGNTTSDPVPETAAESSGSSYTAHAESSAAGPTSIPLLPGNAEDVTAKGYANTNANVRCGPGTSYAIVGGIQKSTEVQIIGTENGMYKVLFNGDIAFVACTSISQKIELNKTEPEKKNPYYIYCELGSFTVTIYSLDEYNEYTVVAKQFSSAIGKTTGLTPVGKFKIQGRERWHKFGSIAYAQYAVKYNNSGNGLFFHSGLYKKKNNATLKVSSYNAIGTKNTSGCFRMVCENAKWIYDNCPDGTVVEIVNGSPRGTVSAPPADLKSGTKKDPTDLP